MDICFLERVYVTVLGIINHLARSKGVTESLEFLLFDFVEIEVWTLYVFFENIF